MYDLTAVGAMLGGDWESLEVQNVSGPAFALDDSSAGYDAARADAITKAKTQAHLLAKQLGVSSRQDRELQRLFWQHTPRTRFILWALECQNSKAVSHPQRSDRRKYLQRLGLHHLRNPVAN